MTLDIKAREDFLEREQKTWRAEKTVLEREIANLKAERVSIVPRIKAARTKLSGLKSAILTLQTASENYGKEHTLKDKQLEEKQHLSNRLSAELEALEKTIQKRKETADSEVETFFTRAKEKVEKKIATLNDLKVELEDNIVAMQGDIRDLKELLRDLKSDTSKAIKSLETTQASVEGEKTILEDEIKVLKSDRQHLYDQISEYTAQKAKLTKQYLKIQIKIKEFRDYEARAWKLLNAKDEELQQKDFVVRQKEQAPPSHRSFLPPIDE